MSIILLRWILSLMYGQSSPTMGCWLGILALLDMAPRWRGSDLKFLGQFFHIFDQFSKCCCDQSIDLSGPKFGIYPWNYLNVKLLKANIVVIKFFFSKIESAPLFRKTAVTLVLIVICKFFCRLIIIILHRVDDIRKSARPEIFHRNKVNKLLFTNFSSFFRGVQSKNFAS